MEPLQINDDNRFTAFPIKQEYQDIWDLYLTHKKLDWVVDEVDLSKDYRDWKKLNDGEQYFIKHVLAFFAASDGIVMENLAMRFCSEIKVAEVRAFYSMQMKIEQEHNLMYSLLIETYITNEVEKAKLFDAITHIPAVAKKAKWAQKWIESGESLGTRIVAFAAVEGIFFSGSFCCIYWIKARGGILPGLCNSNDFIARDEGLHCQMACTLYRQHIMNKLSLVQIKEIIFDAVEIEKEFIIESLPCSLLGMNSTSMCEYIEFVAGRLVQQLGYNNIYPNARQPFSFMDRICLENQSNFFETRPTEYQKNIGNIVDLNKLSEDVDF